MQFLQTDAILSINGFFVRIPEEIGRVSGSDVLQNKITVVSIEITRDTRPDGKR